MDRVALADLVESFLTGEKIFPDVIPEGTALPALTYSHIANVSARELSGSKTNSSDTWRIRVIGKRRSECDAVLKKLENLDNSSSDTFQKCFIIFVGDTAPTEEDDVVASYIDLRTYDR